MNKTNALSLFLTPNSDNNFATVQQRVSFASTAKV